MTDFFKAGKTMYLAGIAFLGIISILSKDFILSRPRPWQEPFLHLNPGLAYISGALLIISVMAVFLKRYQMVSLVLLVGLIFCLATTRHVVNLWRDYINGFKSLVLISGALLIMTSVYFPVKIKTIITWLSIVIVFVYFEACAYAHYEFAAFVEELIPKFIPFRQFFTYFAGVCLAAGGIGLLIPKVQNLAALLSGIMITGWFFLLHIPRAFTEKDVLSECIGVGESFSMAGICFLLYGIFRNQKT